MATLTAPPLNGIHGSGPEPAHSPERPLAADAGWYAPPAPPEPKSVEEAGLSEHDVESLIFKTLLHYGPLSGSALADHMCLPRAVLLDTLGRMREDLSIAIRSSSGVSDYVYQLTDPGHSRAKQHRDRSPYLGPAPAPMAVYERAVAKQSVRTAGLTLGALTASLRDLSVKPELVSRLCQAANDGGGLFLFGKPGNGKTTLAERLCRATGQYIWVPYVVSVGADLIRVFDAACHERVEANGSSQTRFDRRWVLIRRPTVVVGGELKLEQLDAQYQPLLGVHEAPLQMKAAGGALVIDDFGRQRASSSEILNRLIVPLEKRMDFINLASGRQVRTPFDLLFVLSTNLEPRELVDEAFLRRIPYKIEVGDPDVAEFRQMLENQAAGLGMGIKPGAIDWLLEHAYRAANRTPRYCHARDLLRQVRTYCSVHAQAPWVSQETLGVAVHNYFAAIS